MKNLRYLAQKLLPQANIERIVHYISAGGILKKLSEPILSSKLKCSICNGSDYYAVFVEPAESDEGLWICANSKCASNFNLPGEGAISPLPKSFRAQEWPLFCEINGIGNLHHDIKFELVEQSEGKIEYMKKFVENPLGILLMQGDRGTGKTYAAMAMCEKFTRTSQSCAFTTQQQMQLDLKNIPFYQEKIARVELLVVDDFGLVDHSSDFMKFFMDLINTRMQWKRRGTIITTNLNDVSFAKCCGDALLDRILTGQKFAFMGETRRKAVIL